MIPFTGSQIVNHAVTDRDDGSISRSQASEFQVVFAWAARESFGDDCFFGITRVRFTSEPLMLSGGLLGFTESYRESVGTVGEGAA